MKEDSHIPASETTRELTHKRVAEFLRDVDQALGGPQDHARFAELRRRGEILTADLAYAGWLAHLEQQASDELH